MVVTNLQEVSSVSGENSSKPFDENFSVGTLTYTRAGLASLFGWLLWGDFAWNMKERAIGPIAQLMLGRFEAPVWIVGLLLGSIPSAIGLILGPIISVKSDRHRGRWGRRIPFILIPTPFIVLTIIGLAMTANIADWIHLHSGVHTLSPQQTRILVFAVIWTALDIATVVANSLVGALFNDVVPQGVIGKFFGLFRVVSLIAGIIFNYSLMGKADAHYRAMIIILAFVYGAGFTLMCLMVKEGEYPPSPPREETHAGWISPLISYLKECFSHPYYLWVFAATILGGLATSPINTFSVFHAHSVGMSDGTYGKCLALSYVISLVLSYPLGMLADRFHPLRLGIVSIAIYGAGTAFGFLYGYTPAGFFAGLLLHTVCSGTYFTCTASISQRLFPRDRFAEIGSGGGIIAGICYIIMPPALGAFVQWMHHDYRYVFLIASILSALSLISYVVLYRWFIALGGDEAYVAP